MANILDLPRDQFLASLNELAAQGVNTDDLRRQYRQKNSFFAPIFDWASGSEQAIADQGRTTAGMGLLSKEAGTTGMDALRSLQLEPSNFVAGLLSGGAQAVDAPAAAAQGLIPAQDMQMEALGTAGTAQLGGAAMTAPRGSLRAGALRSEYNLPAARTEAEAMARQILEMRAAGRAGDVTDAMMAQADPQYMFNNTPLPMDEASRMARAGEMGFDVGTPLYHGTPTADIQAFMESRSGASGPGVYTSQLPSTASNYAQGMNLFNRKNAFTDDTGTWIEGGNVLEVVGPKNLQSSEDWTSNMMAQMSGGNMSRPQASAMATQQAINEGFYGAQSRSPISSMGQNVVIFDPTNIRSRFARFDPAFSHLANLNAANASPLAGILAMPNEEERNRQLGLLFGGY